MLVAAEGLFACGLFRLKVIHLLGDTIDNHQYFSNVGLKFGHVFLYLSHFNFESGDLYLQSDYFLCIIGNLNGLVLQVQFSWQSS